MLHRICLTLLILSVIPPALSQDTKPAEPIPHGLDTTATATKYPDYVAQINDRLRQGVTNDTNAYVALLGVYDTADWEQAHREGLERELKIDLDALPGPKLVWIEDWAEENNPDDGEHHNLGEAVADATWTAEQRDVIANWLETQAPALDAVAAAVRRPAYFAPLVRPTPEDSLISVLLPQLGPSRSIARTLTGRALLAIEAGDPDAALDDLESLRRLADHIRHEPILISNLVAVSIDALAARVGCAMLADAGLQPAQARRLAALMPYEPTGLTAAQTVDLGERAMAMDSLDLIVRGKLAMNGVSNNFFGDADIDRPLQMTGSPLFDRDRAIARFGGYYDELGDILREPSLSDMQARMEGFEEKLQKRRSPAWLMTLHALAAAGAAHPDATPDVLAQANVSRDAFTDTLIDMLAGIFIPAVDAAAKTERAGHLSRGLVQIGAGLARYEHEHGTFPDTLDALAAWDDSITIPPDLDGQPLRYTKLNDGYRLYSVGQNLEDNDGEDDPRNGDVVIQVAR